MEWFGRGVGSGAPLFPGRLETKSGPGAAASAASEPKAEACTATLSQAESLPSHPFSDAQGAEDPQGQGQRLGSYILCLEICVNHNISPKYEKCGKPLCRAGGNKNKIQKSKNSSLFVLPSAEALPVIFWVRYLSKV